MLHRSAGWPTAVRRWRRSPTYLLFGVLLLASPLFSSLLFSTPCAAQTDPDDLARRHFESGAAYFEQAEYDAALREFQKAYELSKRPQILRNISIVEERMGNLAGAVAALDQYLLSATDDPDIDTVRIRRDNLKKRLEEQSGATPPPVVVDPQPEPKEEPRPPPPPEETSPEDAAEDDALADEPPSEGSSLVPAYVLITLGGLAGVGSVVTGYLANEEHKNLDSSCSPDCSNSDVATGKSLALTSTILTGAAIVGVGSGLIWLAVAGGDSDSGHSSGGSAVAGFSALPEVNVALGTEGGFGEAWWRF